MKSALRFGRKMPLVLMFVLGGFCSGVAGIADDAEVKALKEKAEAAANQTEMNLVSKELCDLLDLRLKSVEDTIRKQLSGDSVALFDKAAAAWRDFRMAQVKFEGSFYEGGSIQPLVHNQAYSALTEIHVDDLFKFKEEVIEDR